MLYGQLIINYDHTIIETGWKSMPSMPLSIQIAYYHYPPPPTRKLIKGRLEMDNRSIGYTINSISCSNIIAYFMNACMCAASQNLDPLIAGTTIPGKKSCLWFFA